VEVAIRRKKPYDSYRYSVPVQAVSGKHGVLSIRIHRQPDGWRWELTDNDSPFKSGTNIGLEDAKSEAQYYLNKMLLQKGEPEHFFSLNPDSWFGLDDEKRLGDRVRPANMGSKVRWFGSKSK
jgi:hypothetical protein